MIGCIIENMLKNSCFVLLTFSILIRVGCLLGGACNYLERVNQYSGFHVSSQSVANYLDKDQSSGEGSEFSGYSQAGCCRLGGCCHYMAEDYSSNDLFVFMYDFVASKLLVPESPLLEGLKRPPRQS